MNISQLKLKNEKFAAAAADDDDDDENNNNNKCDDTIESQLLAW